MIDKELLEKIVEEFDINKINKIEEGIFKNKFKKFTLDFEDLLINSNLFEKPTGKVFCQFRSKSFDYSKGFIVTIIQVFHRVEFTFRFKEFKTNFFGMTYNFENGEKVDFKPFNEYYYNSNDFQGYIKFKQVLDENLININESEIEFFNHVLQIILNFIEDVKKEYKLTKIQHLEKIKKSILEVDKDNNGEVDLVDDESFYLLLNKHQKNISDIDKVYVQKFVKISMYLKTKKKNTQKIFESINKTKNEKELNELFNLLKNQIHSYELLVFHSISMIISLVDNDYISFYEIYESFDQLGVFNSNWENEVSKKLTNINKGLKDIMYSLDEMESNIVGSLRTLNYTTQDSFSKLNSSISSQLGSINSSIDFNNLLTGIQTYQMYKINKNTKRIE